MIAASGQPSPGVNLWAAKNVAATYLNGRGAVFAVNNDNSFWLSRQLPDGRWVLSSFVQMTDRDAWDGYMRRYLGGALVDLEAANIQGRVVLYALRQNSQIWQGTFVEAHEAVVR